MHAFDVLGDPVRRRIVELLAGGEQSSGAVVDVIREEFGLSQPGVSQHLRVLREHGFATVRPAGARRIYALDPTPLREVDAWLDHFRAFWSQRLDALGTEIARGKKGIMTKPRIYTMSFARVYPLYVAKAQRKGRTGTEVDEIICWLTGYSQQALEAQVEKQTSFETFLAEAPRLNPSRGLIKGVVCGVRVEDIEEPTMQEIRYLDKLIDELAKGKAMEKILR